MMIVIDGGGSNDDSDGGGSNDDSNRWLWQL